MSGISHFNVSKQSVCSVEVDMEDDEDPDHEDETYMGSEKWLLYEQTPSKAWAIATQKLMQVRSKNMMGFKVIRVISVDKCFYNNDLPLTEGHELFWPKIQATSSLGSNILSIKSRIPSFLDYLNNRKEQGEL